MRNIDRTFWIFGFQFHIRIESPAFLKVCEEINALIRDDQFDRAARKLKDAEKIFGYDLELKAIGARLRFEQFKSTRSHH